MKVTFLGNGASEGIPALFCECNLCRQARQRHIYHTRSQLMINDDLLIDFPPDTYYRSLHYGIDLSKIENVLITHSHSDHLYSEDFFMRGLLSSFGLPTETVTLHGNAAVCGIFERNGCARRKGSYERKEKGQFNGYKVFNQSSEYVVRKRFETFTAGKYTVTALPATHIPSEDCFIYLIREGGKTLLYATDTEYFHKDVWDYLIGNKVYLDALIVDGTYGLAFVNDIGHMNFFDNARLRNDLLQKEIIDENTKCFVTHVFHGAAKDLDTLEKALPQGYRYPQDNFSFDL